jgi:hypothetical protein
VITFTTRAPSGGTKVVAVREQIDGPEQRCHLDQPDWLRDLVRAVEHISQLVAE